MFSKKKRQYSFLGNTATYLRLCKWIKYYSIIYFVLNVSTRTLTYRNNAYIILENLV